MLGNNEFGKFIVGTWCWVCLMQGARVAPMACSRRYTWQGLSLHPHRRPRFPVEVLTYPFIYFHPWFYLLDA